MAEVINMPRLSDTMEEGTVASWLKKVGDKIEEGDILAEIETDKATMEFESFHEGTLLHIGVQEGETTKVDELLAIIGEDGEDISEYLNGGLSKKEESNKDEVTDSASEDKKDASDENESLDAKEETSSEELPEGVTVVTMPRLSDTMEEGTVATWLKKVGDMVEEGDILAEIETDKATMEFESFQSGTLLQIGLEEGESAKVDALLAIIGPEGTDVSSIAKNFKTAGTDSEKKESKKEAPKKEESSKTSEPKETKSESKSGSESKSEHNASGRIFVSPLAKKMAEEKGLNLSQVKGSGENGRIVKRDIENYSSQYHA